MRFLRLIFVVITGAALAASSFAQQPKYDLDRVVPRERQHQLGIDGLSPEQRAGIAKLIVDTYQLGAQNGQAPSRGSGGAIETQVDGDFNGWEGETVVKLMNGQIWQQSGYYYHYHYTFMPKVLIYSSGGGFKMKVDGVEKAVGVVRLK